jgi:1-acyl-sn-glycerol-3-phosphate acyltransferase
MMNPALSLFTILGQFTVARRRQRIAVANHRSIWARWAQMLFFALVIRPVLRLFIGLRVRGNEHLQQALRERRPFILIANHASHLDTAALLSLLPLGELQRVRPVAAADYFERNRLIAWASRTFFNILPIARTRITAENHPVERMKAALAAGDSLIVFPEGTRGNGAGLQQFRPGLAHLLCERPGLPVIPAYLVNLGRSLPKGEFVPVPLFAELRFGAPVTVQGTRHAITAQLESAVRALQEQA